MKKRPRPLINRLELAAGACKAMNLRGPEAAIREAIEILKRLEPSLFDIEETR